jgi:hypothetical protein
MLQLWRVKDRHIDTLGCGPRPSSNCGATVFLVLTNEDLERFALAIRLGRKIAIEGETNAKRKVSLRSIVRSSPSMGIDIQTIPARRTNHLDKRDQPPGNGPLPDWPYCHRVVGRRSQMIHHNKANVPTRTGQERPAPGKATWAPGSPPPHNWRGDGDEDPEAPAHRSKTALWIVPLAAFVAVMGWLYIQDRTKTKVAADTIAAEARSHAEKERELEAFRSAATAMSRLQKVIQPAAGGWLFNNSTFMPNMPAWRIDCGAAGVYLTFQPTERHDDVEVSLVSAGLESADCAMVLPIIGEALNLLVTSHASPN